MSLTVLLQKVICILLSYFWFSRDIFNLVALFTVKYEILKLVAIQCVLRGVKGPESQLKVSYL